MARFGRDARRRSSEACRCWLSLSGRASTGLFPASTAAPRPIQAPRRRSRGAFGNGPGAGGAALAAERGCGDRRPASMANGATLAMEFIASNPEDDRQHHAGDQDTRRHQPRRGRSRQQAVAEGHEPGSSARSRPTPGSLPQAPSPAPAGLSLIGFSSNSGAAQPGVYLLNVPRKRSAAD